ncbi:aspartate/glutamate racemase family protein [Salinibacillus xinjiangensis]|uniref:Aspartate racemase n=1 Tax=Salinibacillus xinjiangensis TaxID=1229268 RepID=A0A6G1XA44_9BACI|nr:aspartate/glutamate racemase family protein [Salinibacillus xinjiangensis]MRG87799.1 hypothetical protein [Salinibacillus xinjiangensis]
MDIVVPDAVKQQYIHPKIVEELENGIVSEETKSRFFEIIQDMNHFNHIDGIILGCTELPMLIKDGDIALPILDTKDIHVEKIVDSMFS